MNFFLVTLGCKVNQYESSALKKAMLNRGYTYDKNKPDIIIINTCAVTGVSAHKSRQMINRYHKKYPSSLIVVMGCYAQDEADYIEKNSYYDILVGTSNRSIIPDLIEEYLFFKKKIKRVDKDTRKFSYESFNTFSNPLGTRAFLKIQDGCDAFCSYCLIPYVRGKARYRDKDEIMDEVAYLVKEGYKEIVLTGIDMASYRYGENLEFGFSNLLEEILSILPKEFRIRISSIELRQIDDLFLSLLKKDKRIVSHLHIPLQSGSNIVLKKMNRRYKVEEYLNVLTKLRKIRKDIAITTDVMVGFLLETEEEFNNSYNFIKKCKFSMIHPFPYSVRKGTKASLEKEEISPLEKKRRVHLLIELAKKMHIEYASSFLGKEVKILIEEKDKKDGMYKGYTENYLLVKIPYSSKIKVGDIFKVKYDKIEEIY